MKCSLLLQVAAAAAACIDEGDGRFNRRLAEHRSRMLLNARSSPGATLAPTEKFRPLEWGDINFVHVTDTHGWLSGHPDQVQYAADWGDLISFSEHLQGEADRRDVDFLMIDTGDRHDGTGLSDATKLDGSVSQPLFAQAKFDTLSIGNHELYKRSVLQQEYSLLRPHYGDRYLASNIEIYTNGEWVPAGHRYRIFETKNRKFRILAFSFIYDFTGYDNGTRVVPVERAVNSTWFQNVIKRDDIDLVLLTGHIPVRGFDELDAAYKAIRRGQPHTPIQGFGGHTHLRDYRILDDNAVALESGRYLETIGWASIKFGGGGISNATNATGTNSTGATGVNSTSTNSTSNSTKGAKTRRAAAGNNSAATNGSSYKATFTRRYLDFSPVNFAYHTNTSLNATGNSSLNPFQTPNGLAISQALVAARANLTLDKKIAYVNQTYWIERAPYPGPDSLISLSEKVVPLLKGNVSRDDKPRYLFINTGTFRYDLFKGDFTLDQKYIVSPFDDSFSYYADVPKKVADQILDHLNKDYSYIRKRDAGAENDTDSEPLLSRIFATAAATTSDPVPTFPAATSVYLAPALNKSQDFQLYKGYATHDDLGGDGDDTPHIKYDTYKIPNAVVAKDNVDNSTDTVDVVHIGFLSEYITPLLKKNGVDADPQPYGGVYVRDLIEEYFQQQGARRR